MSENQKHPYHLVDPSPWPLVTALSLLVLAYGFVTFMHDDKVLLFAIGSVALILSSFFWWIIEAGISLDLEMDLIKQRLQLPPLVLYFR